MITLSEFDISRDIFSLKAILSHTQVKESSLEIEKNNKPKKTLTNSSNILNENISDFVLNVTRAKYNVSCTKIFDQDKANIFLFNLF